jgi:hypothetical protein
VSQRKTRAATAITLSWLRSKSSIPCTQHPSAAALFHVCDKEQLGDETADSIKNEGDERVYFPDLHAATSRAPALAWQAKTSPPATALVLVLRRYLDGRHLRRAGGSETAAAPVIKRNGK